MFSFIEKLLLSTLLVFFSISITYGQQNLFNIPSGDITPKGKFFYQHQFNVYQKKFESKSHLVYGLGKGWEIGANLLNVGVNHGYINKPVFMMNDVYGKEPLGPLLVPTAQKQFKVGEHFKLSVGTQTGLNLSENFKNKTIATFIYGLSVYETGNHMKFVVGPYYANNAYLGKVGNNLGFVAGFEIPLSKRWFLMVDHISGNNYNSVTVPGFMYNLTKRVQLCAGYQIPNPGSPIKQAIVLELNLLNYDIPNF